MARKPWRGGPAPDHSFWHHIVFLPVSFCDTWESDQSQPLAHLLRFNQRWHKWHEFFVNHPLSCAFFKTSNNMTCFVYVLELIFLHWSICSTTSIRCITTYNHLSEFKQNHGETQFHAWHHYLVHFNFGSISHNLPRAMPALDDDVVTTLVAVDQFNYASYIRPRLPRDAGRAATSLLRIT